MCQLLAIPSSADVQKLVAYIAICVGLYGVHLLFEQFELGTWTNRGFALVLMALFALLVINVERKEFQKLPYVGKYFVPRTV